MRERIFTLVEKADKHDKASRYYDWFIMIVALLSIVPMMFREMPQTVVAWFEVPTVYILFFDYILHWMTYDIKCQASSEKQRVCAFIKYPFTILALMDIVGLLPSLGLLHGGFRVLRLFRLGKLLRYSESCRRIANVFKSQKKTLLSVLMIAVAYIFISALVMYVTEPEDNFPHFFQALYWATTALTTVGYGDVYPSTLIGKFVSMLSSIFGVAVIAMPAGIVTAGFLDELNKDLAEEQEEGREDSEEKK